MFETNQSLAWLSNFSPTNLNCFSWLIQNSFANGDYDDIDHQVIVADSISKLSTIDIRLIIHFFLKKT